jgi:hypothetical protein
MFGTKPDVSSFQEFGVEGWLHRRIDQRQDTKFDSGGEPVIFVGYPSNQQGFLVWCPGRGPTKIVVSNNLVFGTRCPLSSRSPVELIDEANTEIPLSAAPAALTLQEVDNSTDLHIVGTFKGNFVLSDSALDGLRMLSPVSLPNLLYYTHTRNLSSVHLALADSYQLYTATLPETVFPQEGPALLQLIKIILVFGITIVFLPFLYLQVCVLFPACGCLRASGMGLQRHASVWVVIVKSRARIIFQTKIIAQCSPVVTFASCWPWRLQRATRSIRQTLSKRFCIASWTMWIFILILLLATSVPLAWCSNFSKPFMVLSRLL